MMIEPQVFEEKPQNFSPSQAVAGCYLEYQEMFLMVKRHPNAFAGKKWCLPGGRIEPGETPRVAAARELAEETGVQVSHQELVFLGELYMRWNHFEYPFAIFWKRLDTFPSVKIDLKEHTEGKWVTLEEAFSLSLIGGGKRVLQFCHQQKKR